MDETPTDPGEAPFWRVWLLPIGFLALVLIIFTLGKAGVLPEPQIWIARVEALSASPWGVPALIGLFCVGAFIGVPQFLLYAGALVAFGTWPGIGYAWLATLCSGGVTFWTGRFGGEALFNRFAGGRAQSVSGFLGGNAFKASALVRLVPAGPFLLVNMAFGISKARFPPFVAGLGLGALPKLGVVALIGQGMTTLSEGSFLLGIMAMIGAGLIWFWLASVRGKSAK